MYAQSSILFAKNIPRLINCRFDICADEGEDASTMIPTSFPPCLENFIFSCNTSLLRDLPKTDSIVSKLQTAILDIPRYQTLTATAKWVLWLEASLRSCGGWDTFKGLRVMEGVWGKYLPPNRYYTSSQRFVPRDRIKEWCEQSLDPM